MATGTATTGRTFTSGWWIRPLLLLGMIAAGIAVALTIGVRLVPVLPFAAVSYACGLSALRPRDYLLGTTVGILPAATAFAAIGTRSARHPGRSRNSSPR
jgi:uncharacterized membrane protein YdjX (TVP38/TMEM64 family)